MVSDFLAKYFFTEIPNKKYGRMLNTHDSDASPTPVPRATTSSPADKKPKEGKEAKKEKKKVGVGSMMTAKVGEMEDAARTKVAWGVAFG